MKIRYFFKEYIQIWHHVFIVKKYYFNIISTSISTNSDSKFLNFMSNVNLNNGNETKPDIFHKTDWNLTSFLICRKILKYFSGFFNCHLLISWQKWTQAKKKQNKIKLNIRKCDSIFTYLQSSTLFKWLLKFNLFIVKVKGPSFNFIT